MSAVPAFLGDTYANFELLAATVANSKVCPTELRRHIDGLKAIEPSIEFFGRFDDAARIILTARINELEQRYAELRPVWQENLDAIRDAATIEPEMVNPHNGPGFLSALRALEDGKANGFREEAFGDLMDEAIRLTDDGIKRFKEALATIALMVVDPDGIDMDNKAPLHVLELIYEHSKSLPLTMEAFFGDEDKLAEAKRRHPIWLRKQRELMEKRRMQAVEGGIEARDEKEHRNRVADAAMTAEQRGARLARMQDAAQPMYDLIRRMTEIAHTEEGVGAVDANGLVEVVQRSEALVARVEGRVN